MPTVRDTPLALVIPMRADTWVGVAPPRFTWNPVSGKVGVPGHVLLLQDSSRVMTELLEYESLDAIWYERSEGVPWGPAATRFGIAGHWGVAGDSVVVVADGLSGALSWYSLEKGGARVEPPLRPAPPT